MDKNAAEAIRAVYSVFSRSFFRPCDKTFFEDWNKISDLLKKLLPESEEDVEAVLNTGREKDEETLNRLYSSIFLTGAYGKIISPCESVYLSSEGLEMDDQRDEVLKEYADHKKALADGVRLPEDHLSAEFAFIAFLSEDNETRKSFIENHILKWVPLLEKDLEEYGGDIYLHIMRIARSFMVFDLEVL